MKNEKIEKRMVNKQNPLTGDYLCYIPGIPGQAYFIKGKKRAEKFCTNVTEAFKNGELIINCFGEVELIKKKSAAPLPAALKSESK